MVIQAGSAAVEGSASAAVGEVHVVGRERAHVYLITTRLYSAKYLLVNHSEPAPILETIKVAVSNGLQSDISLHVTMSI